MTGRFDTIFFDFDGVLAESEAIKTDAFRVVYAEFGDEIIEKVIAYHRANAGISRLVKIRHCHKAFLGIDLSDAAVDALGKVYSDAVVDQVVASDWVPGAKAFLDAHQGQLNMYVISGTPEDELGPIVQRRGMADYFDEVRGSPRLKGDIGRELIDRYDLDPARIAFIGDAPTDCHAALELGVHFVGRVREGHVNPFPMGTEIHKDLTTFSV